MTMVIRGSSWTFAIDLAVTFANGDPLPTIVSVIENYSLKLRCSKTDSSSQQPQIVWKKYGDDSFIIYNNNLEFSSIQIIHAGDYYCEENLSFSSVNVTIRVLYPPDKPTITGPNIVEIDSTFTLNCNATSEPEPSFYWTTDASSTTQVVVRGRTYSARLEDSIDLYCWAENTMFPTREDSVTIAQYQKAAITAIKPAYIWELFNAYTFNVTGNVVVDCRIGGSPQPRVYWTRDGDPSFRFDGERLFIPNVKMNFTGYYSCHAENDLKPSGLPARVGSDVKNTLITITDPGIDDICAVTCQNRVDAALASCPTPTTTKPCTNECGSSVIAALVVGWIVAAILLVTFMFCCIRNCDKKRKAMKEQADSQAHESEFTRPKMVPDDRLASRPVLPVRPDVSRRQDEGTYAYIAVRPDVSRRQDEGTYAYIAGDEGSSRRIPFSKMSGKYDYVEPNPADQRHDYLILNPPSPATQSRTYNSEGYERATEEDIKNGVSNPTSSSFIQSTKDNQTTGVNEGIASNQTRTVNEGYTDNYLEPVKTENDTSN